MTKFDIIVWQNLGDSECGECGNNGGGGDSCCDDWQFIFLINNFKAKPASPFSIFKKGEK